MHPGKLIDSLEKQVNELGIRIYYHSEVEAVSPNNEISVKGGPVYQAGWIVAALNGYVQKLFPAVPVKPARGTVILTSALRHIHWPGVWHYDNGYIYFRMVGKRLLLGGARNLDKQTEETTELAINTKIKNALVDFADRYLTPNESWSVEEEWSGIMGFSQNKQPLIHEIHPNCWYIGGFSGMGIAMSSYYAQQVVNRVLD